MDMWIGIAQGIVFLAVAPLLTGFLRKLRSRGQLRAGPSVLQPYYDLAKLFRKGRASSSPAPFVFLAAPCVVFACQAALGFATPLFALPLWRADLILIVAVMGLSVFWTVLAGVSLGAPFGGLGSSRTAFLHSLAEPAFFALILALSLKWRTTDLVAIVERQSAGGILDPVNVLLFLATCNILLAEAHRLPVDNTETTLELTMTYRAALLDYGGAHLALFEWAESLRLLFLLTFLTGVFLPPAFLAWDATASVTPLRMLGAFLIPAAKLVAAAAGLTIWELSNARVRFSAVAEPVLQAFVLTGLALSITLITTFLPGGAK
jgi:formate hydrogenlyase subunit 4